MRGDGAGRREVVGECPAAHLCAVEFEVVEAERLGRRKTIGTGRHAAQPLGQQVHDGLGPRSGMVAAGAARDPVGATAERAGAEVGGEQRVEPTAGQAELRGGGRGGQHALPERVENVTNESGRMPLAELLSLFIDGE